MNITAKKLNPLALAMLVAIGATGAMFSAPLYAYDETSTSVINVDKENVILRGYDPVAYFTLNTPTPGNKKFSTSFDGALYYFASADNLKEFEANPAKYVPQFGGFCAMGAAMGKKLDGDPEVWKVVDGKLYLNVNSDVKVKWSEDIPGNLKKAYETWPSIKDKAPRDL